MNIAVVRNRNNQGIMNQLGQECPERYGRRSVQAVMDALRLGGHRVKVLEGDLTLPHNLAEFLSPDPKTDRPSGMVFNMSYGIQGESRYSHVPMMLELAGVPYTGAGPFGHTISLDKVLSKILMERAGVPTPRFCTMGLTDEAPSHLRYPLVVKPRHESTSNGIRLVTNAGELREAVSNVVTKYQQDALVEEYIDGREVDVCVLGNGPFEVLPIVEIDFRGRPVKMLLRSDKFHKSPVEPGKLCPAPLSSELASKLSEIATEVFRLCHCKDYARVDLRIDQDGTPSVLEINSMATLGQGGGFALAAEVAGYRFEQLVCRIVDITHQRYFGGPAPRGKPHVRKKLRKALSAAGAIEETADSAVINVDGLATNALEVADGSAAKTEIVPPTPTTKMRPPDTTRLHRPTTGPAVSPNS